MNVKIFRSIKKGHNKLVYGYLCAMFSLFLFYFRNYYFDITPSKYNFFTFATLVLIIGIMILSCVLFITKEYTWKGLCEEIHHFSISDWAMVALLISHIITTLICDNPHDSLTGSQGRQMGLNFTFLIVSVYFIISRWYQQEKGIILLYLSSTALVVLLGVLNFYGIDPFQFSKLLTDFDAQRYLSTMGNITFFAHLICLTLPISCFLFLYAKQRNSRILYGVFIATGAIGLFIANLDGAYLGIFAFFLFFLYCCLSDYERLRDFFFILLIILFSGQVLAILSQLNPQAGRGFATISYYFVASSIALPLCICSCILYIVITRYQSKIQKWNFVKIRKIYFSSILLIILSMIGMMFYFTVIDPNTDIGFFENYLRYSDLWGTGRGFIWNRLIPLYFDNFSFVDKLFGSGLDTVRTLMVNNFEAVDIMYYDNAHNEYIQYLVTSGLVGLATYLTLFLSIQIRLFKQGRNNPWMMAILGCLIAHGAQAITGLNQPITTPLLFILIAIGECHLRQQRKELSASNLGKHH